MDRFVFVKTIVSNEMIGWIIREKPFDFLNVGDILYPVSYGGFVIVHRRSSAAKEKEQSQTVKQPHVETVKDFGIFSR